MLRNKFVLKEFFDILENLKFNMFILISYSIVLFEYSYIGIYIYILILIDNYLFLKIKNIKFIIMFKF